MALLLLLHFIPTLIINVFCNRAIFPGYFFRGHYIDPIGPYNILMLYFIFYT